MIPQYDKALRDFFQVNLKGKAVPLVGPVPPHRAFARASDLMKAEGQKVTDERWTPLPFVSFTRMPAVQNMERFRRADLRHVAYSEDANIIEQARMPFPYDIPYQVDIWCEFEDDFVTLIEAYLRKFRGPIATILVDHGKAYGEFKIFVNYDGGMDNSDLESDDADRVLRYTLNFTVEGFLSFPTRKVKTVRSERTTVAVVQTAADLTKEPEISEETLVHEYKE